MKLSAVLTAALVLASACDHKTMACKRACIAKVDECAKQKQKAALDACKRAALEAALACERACGD